MRVLGLLTGLYIGVLAISAISTFWASGARVTEPAEPADCGAQWPAEL